MNPLHRFPELKKKTTKNQNENFHFCKVPNITNVKNSKCIWYDIN